MSFDGHELVLAATFYTRRIPIGPLDLDQARIINLAELTESKPALETTGFNLPGFLAGHCRLRNRAKAFCLLTDRERVLLLPQSDGTLVLLLSLIHISTHAIANPRRNHDEKTVASPACSHAACHRDTFHRPCQ